MPDILLWELESVSVYERQRVLSPVVLHFKDNLENEVKELSVETPDREHLLSLIDVDWEFEGDRLCVAGHVSGSRGTDREEAWCAEPLLDDDSGPAPWRAEIILDGSGETIQVIEPALVREQPVTQDASGKMAALRDLDLDWEEWLVAEREAEYKLLIQPNRGPTRWISDYEIRWFNRFELSITGSTRHKRQQVNVIVKLTPSQIKRAAELLGESV